MKIPVKPTDSMYLPPEHAHPGDAGADLYAAEAAVIEPGERVVVPVGFSMAIPVGYAGLVMPRSGLASRHGITVANAPGLIDSGYRGEVKVALINHSREPFSVERGDRIAQLVVVAVATPEFLQVSELEETERGSGGFGSSGLSSHETEADDR